MTSIANGGKAIYGAPQGILVLDARFPGIPGDMGTAAAWPFRVPYRVVKGASAGRVLLSGPPADRAACLAISAPRSDFA